MHPLTQHSQPSPMPLLETLLAITGDSDHSYERAVHQLLHDLIDQRARGQLREGEYAMMLGTGMDVLFFFNYDLELLSAEQNRWYRASVIHQIGHAMLQAIDKIRPDLTGKPFFTEAAHALAPCRSETVGAAPRQASPIHARRWGKSAQAVAAEN